MYKDAVRSDTKRSRVRENEIIKKEMAGMSKNDSSEWQVNVQSTCSVGSQATRFTRFSFPRSYESKRPLLVALRRASSRFSRVNLNPVEILSDSRVNARQVRSGATDSPADQSDQSRAPFGLHCERTAGVTLTRVLAAVLVAGAHHVRVDHLSPSDRLHPRLTRVRVQHLDVHLLQFACQTRTDDCENKRILPLETDRKSTIDTYLTWPARRTECDPIR
jgi:hypothetical protein